MHDLFANMLLVAPRIIGLAVIGSSLLGFGWWACLIHERTEHAE